MASAVLKEHGSCWKSSEKPRLLKATPLKGSVASVDTLKRNGLACEMTGPGRRLPNLCPQYRSVVNFFWRSWSYKRNQSSISIIAKFLDTKYAYLWMMASGNKHIIIVTFRFSESGLNFIQIIDSGRINNPTHLKVVQVKGTITYAAISQMIFNANCVIKIVKVPWKCNIWLSR